MRETDHSAHFFDVRQSVWGRNTTRLIVAPIMCLGLVALGIWFIPAGTALELTPAAIETWSFPAVVGALCVVMGIWGLLKEVLFAVRAVGTSGEWHFCLNDRGLFWNVPQHAHGKESGFSAQLDELKEMELRTIQKEEAPDEYEYWVHFHVRDPIQLKSYSGISLRHLTQKICSAGVPLRQTSQRF